MSDSDSGSATPEFGEHDGVVDDTTVEAAAEPERLYDEVVTYSRGQSVIHVERERLADVVLRLRDEEGFNVCIDVTAVDHLMYSSPRHLPEGIDEERFEVVVQLLSHQHRRRVRVRTQVPAEDPTVPSLFGVHPGTEVMEREVYDMFGIRFAGHPDLTRILMPEDWEGHPLRKDYPVGVIPVQFKGVVNER